MAPSKKNKVDKVLFIPIMHNIGDACYEGPESCLIKKNSFDPYAEYFKDLNNQRRDKTFPTFIRNTNEKNQTIKVSSAFLDSYLPKLLHHCQILDLGVGEGDLSSKVAIYMKGKCENIRYEGIDRSELFVSVASNKLLTLDIRDQNIIIGNCFGGDVHKLVEHPTLLIASQILFYAPDINEFVYMIIRRMGAVAIIIGQSNASFLNYLNRAYAAPHKQTDTESQLDEFLSTQNFISKVKVLYNSVIDFPKEISSKPALLEKIAFNEYESLSDQKEKEAREILEFVAGSPLEYLESTNKLNYFISDIKEHLKNNRDVIGFWNFMTILIPEDQLIESELHARWKTIQKQKFSRDLTQFENALREGNIQIVSTLFKQGLVTCEFYYEEQSMVSDILSIGELLCSFAVYLVTLSYYLRLPLEAIFGEIGGRYKRYSSKEIQKLQFHKYQYDALKLKTDEFLPQWSNEIIAKGHRYSEFTGEKFHIHGLLYACLLNFAIFPKETMSGKLDAKFIKMTPYFFKMIISTGAMSTYTYYKFFNVGNYAIHNINGDDRILDFYLFDQNNLKSINFQTSEGQTALHNAIITNDTAKALSLLNCKATRVDIPDIYGRLPIHYAVEYGNIRIIERLYDRNNDLNIKEFNSRKFIFDCLLFTGKTLFLHAYFADNINNMKTISDAIANLFLGGMYAYSKSQSIKFPENIYFHLVLLLLDPFGFEESLLYKEDDSYKGYTLDTPLHISARFNNTEIIKFLIYSGADTKIANANGETPLHFASAYNNFEIVNLLLKNGTDINYQSTNVTSYYYYAIALKLFFTAITTQSIMELIGEIIFFKVVHTEIFEHFHIIYSGTPLHYAVSGLETNQLFNAREANKEFGYKASNNWGKLEIVKYLLENGADPDLTFRYYVNPDNQVINYALNLKILATVCSVISSNKWASFLIMPVLLVAEYMLPYDVLELKPMEIMGNKIDNFYLNKTLSTEIKLGSIGINGKSYQNLDQINIYNYLKQYTTLNQHTDIADMSFYGLKYLGYLLGIVSDNDIIQINEYGMYKGGSGKDLFIINPNFVGKAAGWKIIIKDYSFHEDTIDLTSFGYVVTSNEDLYYAESVVMNKPSTVISTADSDEILTLYDFPIDEVSNIQFKLSEEIL